MKRVIKTHDEFEDSDLILCMSSIRGSRVKVPHTLPFSFYFSGKNTSHGIRVKPLFNPSKMIISQAGNLKLCDNWEYTPGTKDKHISNHAIREMKKFFKDYIILFLLVWDVHLYDTSVQDYFTGEISLHELIEDLDFYHEYKDVLDKVGSIQELEDVCRKYRLVNFYGN